MTDIKEPSGTYRSRLFMVESTSLYSLYVTTQGALEG